MTARNGNPWTDADSRLLRALYVSGASNAEIAARLGRTQNSIRNRASVMCLSRDWPLYAPPPAAPAHPAAAKQRHPMPTPPQPGRTPKPARKERRCMTCAKPFLSEGAHNRMCAPCRQLPSPFA